MARLQLKRLSWLGHPGEWERILEVSLDSCRGSPYSLASHARTHTPRTFRRWAVMQVANSPSLPPPGRWGTQSSACCWRRMMIATSTLTRCWWRLTTKACGATTPGGGSKYISLSLSLSICLDRRCLFCRQPGCQEDGAPGCLIAGRLLVGSPPVVELSLSNKSRA